jgi:hypothetical protein
MNTIEATFERSVTIAYTNHRGEHAIRHVLPTGFSFEATLFHQKDGPQWFVEAVDLSKGQARKFAMKDISSWKPITAEDFAAVLEAAPK